MNSSIPLAEHMRPTSIDDVVGQRHLLAEGGLLREMIRNGQPISLILWGPPGSGKTTLARIIARELEADFVELSAVTASKKDVTDVVARARSHQKTATGGQQPLDLDSPAPARRTVLFVDEIHRFNKAQQDAFLPHVESGLITLIGATTENPSFEVITPLLSRSRVLVLEPLDREDIIAILTRALVDQKARSRVSTEALAYLADLSGGDARLALGNLEVSLSLAKKVTPAVVETAAQRRIPGYDKQGDMHYDIISAFIKSLRGSSETATLYYLARMLAAGEDPKFIARRMVIFASEDIGLAGNGALSLAVATFQAVERIGLPEAHYNLYHCAIGLARAAKSREIPDQMHAAQALAARYPDAAVPLHLRNAPTKLMKDLAYGKDYEWQADFQHPDGFLPAEVQH